MKLKHIKVNPSDLCNLTCQFCPRGHPDIYPNNNEHMTMETFRKILEGLKDIESMFYFEMVGHGEPTIAKHFQQMTMEMHEAQKSLPNMITRLVTNGARFQRYEEEIKLYDEIVYDIYTDDEEEYRDEILKWSHLNVLSYNMINSYGKMRFEFSGGEIRESWLLLNNRGNKFEIPLIPPLNPPKHGFCVRPNEDITINYNGDYILCCDDWDNVKLGNIHEESLKEYFTSNPNFLKYREQLNNGIREGVCEGCSYPGNNSYFKDLNRRKGDKPWLRELDDEWKANIAERIKHIKALPDIPVDIES